MLTNILGDSSVSYTYTIKQSQSILQSSSRLNVVGWLLEQSLERRYLNSVILSSKVLPGTEIRQVGDIRGQHGGGTLEEPLGLTLCLHLTCRVKGNPDL